MVGEVMKIAMKRLIRDEKGAALILALILLLIGGLMSAALLGHMGSGILAGQVHERRTAELYAADAGVEDAIWKIQNSDGYLPCSPGSEPRIYTITGINGRNVQVTIEFADWSTYKITSIAAIDDGGGTAAIDSATAVESYVSAAYLDLSFFLDNALVSDTSITIKNGVHVTGNVTSGGTVNDKTKTGDINGVITEGVDLDWPTAEDLIAFYLKQVSSGVHYYSDTIVDLNGVSQGLGPLYVECTLDIKSSDQHEKVTLTLNDTLYITGDTQIYGPTSDEPSKLTIDLNGQTIFVASSTNGAHNALSIEKCNIIGSGCIIAVGDIYFAPKGNVGGEDEFVLVMSVEGTTNLQPSGIFYGCIAGNLAVDVASGNDATIVNSGLAEGQDLNFPGVGDDPNELPLVDSVNIESWEIIQQ